MRNRRLRRIRHARKRNQSRPMPKRIPKFRRRCRRKGRLKPNRFGRVAQVPPELRHAGDGDVAADAVAEAEDASKP
jgi:hypothetical protein